MDLVISHVYKDFGRGPVLRDVSLTVRQGETVCLMGPSGLGKTTLLRCVAGLERPESGSITGVPERLGYVFQEDRLCGVFSAVANVRLATGRTLPEAEILRHLEELGLAGSARRPVSQLSGGMRRRVAIARAVCAGPRLLLLDEAFKGLDEQCRRDTVAYIRRHTPGASLLCVTHDPEEAALLGGRCLDLSTLLLRYGTGKMFLIQKLFVDFLPNVWYNSGRNARRWTAWVPFPTMLVSESKNTAKAGAIPSSSFRP